MSPPLPMNKNAMKKFTIMILAVVAVIAMTACHKSQNKGSKYNIDAARTYVEHNDVARATVILDTLVIHHQREQSLEQLCGIASLYVDLAQIQSQNNQAYMLKAATVWSYARKIDQHRAETQMQQLKPDIQGDFTRILMIEDSDDVFKTQQALEK